MLAAHLALLTTDLATVGLDALPGLSVRVPHHATLLRAPAPLLHATLLGLPTLLLEGAPLLLGLPALLLEGASLLGFPAPLLTRAAPLLGLPLLLLEGAAVLLGLPACLARLNLITQFRYRQRCLC